MGPKKEKCWNYSYCTCIGIGWVKMLEMCQKEERRMKLPHTLVNEKGSYTKQNGMGTGGCYKRSIEPILQVL